MKERILLTGSGGYIGNALTLKLQDYFELMCLDSGDRNVWVNQVGGRSLTEYQQAPYFRINLQNIQALTDVLVYFRPTMIIHLASQPSGPYSEISYQHRLGTQINNLTILLNLLCCVKDLGLDTKFVVATTTGVPGAPNGPIEEAQSPNLAGSAYHVSRGFDSANLQLAAKQWKLKILELRTSIVYGTRIDGFVGPVTRLDWDFWFGTVVHRFSLSAKMDMAIKVYGKGLQEKPFISLNDCINSFFNAIFSDIKPGHEIMNQTTCCISVKNLAEMVGGTITHIPNPRVENEEYKMNIKNDKFMKLLGKKAPTADDIRKEIDFIKQDMRTELLPLDWISAFDGVQRPKLVVHQPGIAQ